MTFPTLTFYPRLSPVFLRLPTPTPLPHLLPPSNRNSVSSIFSTIGSVCSMVWPPVRLLGAMFTTTTNTTTTSATCTAPPSAPVTPSLPGSATSRSGSPMPRTYPGKGVTRRGKGGGRREKEGEGGVAHTLSCARCHVDVYVCWVHPTWF